MNYTYSSSPFQNDTSTTTITVLWHGDDPPKSAGTKIFIIWIVLLTCIATIIVLAWCDRRRIKREAAVAAATAAAANASLQNIVSTTQYHTKEEKDQFHRVVYTKAFDVLSHQCQISGDNFKPIQAIDIESGKFTLNADAVTCNSDGESADDVVLAFHRNPKGNDDLCCTGTMCAICLDHYQEGETIVWSQDKDCCHVYHKECFVDYLSNRTNPTLDDNPCPTCRRNFCKVPVE
jgi:hypothetical protein